MKKRTENFINILLESNKIKKQNKDEKCRKLENLIQTKIIYIKYRQLRNDIIEVILKNVNNLSSFCLYITDCLSVKIKNKREKEKMIIKICKKNEIDIKNHFGIENINYIVLGEI